MIPKLIIRYWIDFFNIFFIGLFIEFANVFNGIFYYIIRKRYKKLKEEDYFIKVD